MTDRTKDLVCLEMALAAEAKIRRYVAFALTGDESSDVQIAADSTRDNIQRLLDRQIVQRDVIKHLESRITDLNNIIEEIRTTVSVTQDQMRTPQVPRNR